jgi:2-octaprenyl-6-methoxyphenol hydroxylase|tara:strand:- start:6701 stop:7927 length:1227 start_codon:yes stop_codon:yes gene_type:complete
MKKNFEDVVIFGSGLSAKIMSLVARNAGLSFKLITDKNIGSKPSDDTRSLALSVASKKMLKTLGVNIKTEAVTKMIVIEGGLGDEKIKSRLSFDKELVDEDIAYIAEHSVIEKSIDRVLKLDENEIIKEKVTKIQKEGNFSKIILNNNECLSSKAIIFTEVLDRDLQNIYNVKYNFFEYGQTAISATLRHSKSHKGYAFQFFQKNGPLALLPMSNKRGSNYSSLVWTEKTDNISSLISSKKNLEDSLNNLCSDYLGKISISKGPSSFVLKKLSGVKALSNGALFVGDALRAMHPMAGQAWNQSLRDIAYIADALAESEKLGLDLFQCPSISLFNKKRKIETEALINSIGFLNSIYRSDTSLAKGLRRNIMKLADNYQPLKLFLLNEASGGALERPNLLNGSKPGSNII